MVLSPGDAAPDWKEVPGIDGKKYSLADFKDKEVLVVVFTCNSCAYRLHGQVRPHAAGGEEIVVCSLREQTCQHTECAGYYGPALPTNETAFCCAGRMAGRLTLLWRPYL